MSRKNKKIQLNVIVDLINERKPKTVQELVDLAQKETSLPKKEILKNILDLQDQGKISLVGNDKQKADSFEERISVFVNKNIFWIILAFTLGTVLSVLLIPETQYPFALIRVILGLVFSLFLPGYSLVSFLFQKNDFDFIQIIILSIGTSLALDSIIGLGLNSLLKSIDLVPTILCLAVVTLAFSLIKKVQNR